MRSFFFDSAAFAVEGDWEAGGGFGVEEDVVGIAGVAGAEVEAAGAADGDADGAGATGVSGLERLFLLFLSLRLDGEITFGAGDGDSLSFGFAS